MATKPRSIALVACAGMVLSLYARPLASPDPDAPSIATVVDHALSSIETRIVGVAEAMPEEKYGFVPTTGEFAGVMSFAEQIKHIANDNYGGFSFVLGEKPPADSSATSKADILAHLKGSFALAHRAVATLSAENAVTPMQLPNGHSFTRLAMAIEVIGHSENHYGQTIEYLRMNGIIPPASRPTAK
jgi:hypothetical protein